MTALSIQPIYPIITDINGQPLEDGYIWIGAANLDPQTNPINVYWNAALTIAAPQPIRTLAGYPSRNDTPARLYVGSDYSIHVMNKNGSTVYSAPQATERYNDVVVTANAEEVIYDPPFLGGVQTNVEAKLAQTVSVKDFGAVGDGVTDDTVAVQAALDYIQSTSSTLLIEGICAISTSLEIKRFNWSIVGNSLGTSGIKAIAPMDWMINIGNDSVAFQGRIAAKRFHIDCNNLAGGINAHYTRYSIFDELRINNIESTKTGIKLGQWVNRITNCFISGGDKGIHCFSPDQGATNSLVVGKNAITSSIGIYFDPIGVAASMFYTNNMVIRDNVFDACPKAAIYAPNGWCRGLIITGNYVEACGGAAVSHEAPAGTFTDYYGAMIFPRSRSVGLGWYGLRIYNNQFLSCVQTAPSGKKYLISLERGRDVNIYDNVITFGFSYDALVSLVGDGIETGNITDVKISHTNQEGAGATMPELVKNETTTASGYANFLAKFVAMANRSRFSFPDVIADTSSWSVSGSITVTSSYNNGVKVINFNRSSGAYILMEITNADVLDLFKYRYLTFTGVGQSVTPLGANNLRVVVRIDTGGGYATVFDRARGDDGQISDNRMFFVPGNIIGLQITLSPTFVGEVNVYDLKLVDPWNDY